MKSKALPHIILAVILALTAGVLTIRWLGSQRSAVRGAQAQGRGARKSRWWWPPGPLPRAPASTKPCCARRNTRPTGCPWAAERILADVVGRVTSRDISQDDPITADKLLPRGVTAAGLATSRGTGPPGRDRQGLQGPGLGRTRHSRQPGGCGGHLPGAGQKRHQGRQGDPPGHPGPDHGHRDGNPHRQGRQGRIGQYRDVHACWSRPAEAERLALASDQGSLHFALRHTGDAQGPWPRPGVRTRGNMAGQAPAQGSTQAGPPAPAT